LFATLSTMIIVFLFLKQIIDEQNDNMHELRIAGLELDRRAMNENLNRKNLVATVEKYGEVLTQVAKGDLGVRLSVSERAGNDPLSLLGNRANEMVTSLGDMIRQIRQAASNLNSASTEILAATTQQASSASEQSAAITQTSSTVEEVRTISTQFINRSQEVANAAQRSADISKSGEKVTQDTITSMDRIKAQVGAIAENILGLSERTQQIGEIITTVNEIASQSNILALNAAVEAARAGEHGKGFAVVANEVRNLAEQSRQATAQVRSILLDIQKAINTTVMVTEEGTKVVDQGVVQTEQAGR